MENGSCGKCRPMSLLLLPPQGRTPHILPLLQHGVPPVGNSFANLSSVSASQGLQSFITCSSMSPTHKVQSFRNQLLQQGHNSCRKPAPVWPSLSEGTKVLQSMSSPRGHSLGTSTCSGMGSFLGCRWISAPSWTCRGTAASPHSCNTGCREISALAHGAPPTPCPKASCHPGRAAAGNSVPCDLLKHFRLLSYSTTIISLSVSVCCKSLQHLSAPDWTESLSGRAQAGGCFSSRKAKQ